MPPRRSTSPNLPENRQASGSRGYRGHRDDDREYSRDHREKESRPYGRADRGRGRGRDAEAESFRERQGGDRYRDRRDRDDDNGRGHYSRSRDDRPSETRAREGSSERNGRGGPSAHRRSASPRPSRPHSSRPRSRSHSRSAAPEDKEKEKDKAKPNFGASGLLAAATNTVKKTDGTSTLLKYNEPPEARKPVVGWRLYVFKGSEQVDLLHIHRQSAYLIGRDKAVADITIDHPSCSKQHAVIQFRYVQSKDEFGVSKGVVKPFVIDLESTNGTHVNDETIPTTRFYELQASDVLKFGQSTREYVLLHDEAA